MPGYAVLPFAAMLLAIAICPLWVPHWWERNRNKLLLSCSLGLPVAGFYLVQRPPALLHTLEDYLSFMLLLAALYTISGGIRLTGDLEATPLTNTAFLAVGSVLASLIGTTGASVLLIRALLETNRERSRVIHTVVFFIFLVSNIGGLLTPIGDPPLLLGYLKGVPFLWPLRLWRHWLVAVGALLVSYFVWDSIQHARELLARLRRDRSELRPLRVEGAVNALALLGVVAAIALLHAPWREGLILGLAGVSLWLTPRRVWHANGFTAAPMVEVAVLFLGIFLTMIPALEILRARGPELSVQAPWQFFWATGLLSSFLDNAPTYLAFLALAQGLGLTNDVVGVSHEVLAAISVGAVFMGANTYVGNAPNFMIKAMVEQSGVKMPTFLGYMGYSAAILLPLFVVLTFLLF